MLAFIDNFWVLGVVFLMMIPLVFLMKKTTPRTVIAPKRLKSIYVAG